MKTFLLVPVIVFALTSCSTLTTIFETPQQTVFAAEASYEAALKVAVAYESLPRCTTPPVMALCSRADIVDVLRDADDSVAAAIDAAEKTVRTPGFGDDVYNSAAISAKNAAEAFSTMANNLPK